MPGKPIFISYSHDSVEHRGAGDLLSFLGRVSGACSVTPPAPRTGIPVSWRCAAAVSSICRTSSAGLNNRVEPLGEHQNELFNLIAT